jgi:hypothetical protein
MSYSGKFRLKHPEKYRGNPQNVVFRSLWEYKVMLLLDTNPQVIWWQSEELFIPYQSPVPPFQMRRYFPDFVAAIRQPDQTVKTFMLEVKPLAQTEPPIRPSGKPSKRKYARYLEEGYTFATNQKKWQEAQKYCQQRGYQFAVLTERELFRSLSPLLTS